MFVDKERKESAGQGMSLDLPTFPLMLGRSRVAVVSWLMVRKRKSRLILPHTFTLEPGPLRLPHARGRAGLRPGSLAWPQVLLLLPCPTDTAPQGHHGLVFATTKARSKSYGPRALAASRFTGPNLEGSN